MSLFTFPTAVIFDAQYGRITVSDTKWNRLQSYTKVPICTNLTVCRAQNQLARMLLTF